MIDELPAGWAMPAIQDVCSAVSKRGPSTDRPAFQYIDLGAIDNRSKAIAEASELQVKDAPSRAKQIVNKGDVVFSNVRVYLENIAIVPDALNGEVASTAFCVLRPKAGIEHRYLYYYVSSKPFIQSVNDLQRGNSPPSVQDGDVKSQRIPLAPTPEQKRIVSKIDELFSRIDEGTRALEQVSKLVERYRQSVLKAAVTGELTRDWREARKAAGDPVESGEALLTRILTARREGWEQAELAKMEAKGIKPINDKWKDRYANATSPKAGLEEGVPTSWAQPSLEQATRADRLIAYGILQPGNDDPSGIQMVRVCDVADGVVDCSSLKRVSSTISAQFPRTLLQGGEVLLTLVGTIGRSAVVPPELSGANVARAVGVLAPVAEVLPQWLELCLRSEKTRQSLTANAREVARKTLNLEQLREHAVPIPPIDEQREALSRVDELLSRAGAVIASVIRQSDYANALRQSILRSAFSGKLIPQDPTDEPVTTLLEHITAERGTDDADPKRGRKKKTA